MPVSAFQPATYKKHGNFHPSELPALSLVATLNRHSKGRELTDPRI